MAVAISFRRQRIPMLSASALDDRTRPSTEPAAWMADRLRRAHWSLGSEHVERAARSVHVGIGVPLGISAPPGFDLPAGVGVPLGIGVPVGAGVSGRIGVAQGIRMPGRTRRPATPAPRFN